MTRLVNMLPGIWHGMVDSDRAEISRIMSGLSKAPDSSDVEGAMQSLIRIQFAYKFGQTEGERDLAVIENISASTRLSSARV